MNPSNSTPDGYTSAVIDDVERSGDHIVLRYAGRVFGGILPELLTPEIDAAIVPGAVIIIRLHTPETGGAGQVAHLLIRHPTDDGWAELYADWE